MGVRLPSEYQEAEYLESTRTQFINTGLSISKISDLDTNWMLKLAFTRTDYTQIPFGANADNKQIPFLPSSHKFRVDWATGTNTGVAGYYIPSTEVSVGQIITIQQINGYLTIGDSSAQIRTISQKQTPAGLFARIDDTGSPELSTIAFAKIYSFTAENNGIPLADYIPCYRKSDNKPGMYDLVTKQFFVNQGSGDDFIVGPDVIDSISPLMVAWRRMLMRKPPLDTQLRIAEYGKYCGRSNGGLVEDANWCYTDWYDFPKPHGNITYQQLTGMNASHTFQEINTDTGERTWNYPNISITSNYDKVRFSIKISLLSTCYFVRDDTGEIIFAGRDSIYYGHKNISEIT